MHTGVLTIMDARRLLYTIGPLGIATLCALSGAATGKAKSTNAAKPALQLTGAVTNITLDGPWTSHRIVAELPTGKDVTTTARYTIADPKIATIKDGTIFPIHDGRTTITIDASGRKLVVPVDVRNVTTKATPRFIADVEPILTRSNCNGGGCHGATQGKGGFRLSLQAFDPDLDFASITKGSASRRVSPAQPMNSLLLRKPTMAVPHKGGPALTGGTQHHKLLSEWIRLGMPGPKQDDPTVIKLDVYPKMRTLSVGDTQAIRVVATLSDSTTRDVTAEALISGSDAAVASVSPDGIIKVTGKGSAAVLIRYRDVVTTATVNSPFGAPLKPGAPPDDETRTPASVAMDVLVDKKLAQLGLTPSQKASDTEFLRRVTLDICGTLPSPKDIRDFLADRELDKRERIVDKLLASPEYVDTWTLFWGDYTRASTKALGERGLASMNQWLRSSVALNKPMSTFARELITAKGSNYDNGAAGFFRAERFPEALLETTSQVFLGTRIGCAKCHNHPYERFKQYEYYQMAAFFVRTKTKDGPNPEETFVYNGNGGEAVHPRTGKVMQPTPLDGAPLPADFKGDRRDALADWVTAPSNPFFAKNIVNRVWKQLMGIGLIEPVDDIRVTNPPSNPELLDRLALDFVRGGYDVRQLIRDIVLTDAYQRTSIPTKQNAGDSKYYSHYAFKRMQAEPLMDAISVALGLGEPIAGMPADLRAVQLPDTSVGGNTYFLDLFGRPARNVVCQCERSDAPTIGQLLHIMNGK
ncbi:MAG: hypothetical protein RL169_744, partial [Armatimonadota bacterium]